MLVVSGEDFMATKKTTKNTKKRGRPASKSNTKRTASSEKEYIEKDKAGKPIGKRDCVSCSFCVCHFVTA